ncbi:hypothetical protein E2C01_076019 [Portunus trituberculatus]|uniref:Uncharacterized protein n=1 Tax=Portunus trituberculatus TaxID=210409 RepID=A0A5B7IGR8_PORTR|nr:hypothetical protein [Portunus trituberculatus]
MQNITRLPISAAREGVTIATKNLPCGAVVTFRHRAEQCQRASRSQGLMV